MPFVQGPKAQPVILSSMGKQEHRTRVASLSSTEEHPHLVFKHGASTDSFGGLQDIQCISRYVKKLFPSIHVLNKQKKKVTECLPLLHFTAQSAALGLHA